MELPPASLAESGMPQLLDVYGHFASFIFAYQGQSMFLEVRARVRVSYLGRSMLLEMMRSGGDESSRGCLISAHIIACS